MPLRIDLKNKQFTRWSVIGPYKLIGVKCFWLCRCSCGTKRYVTSQSLRTGISRSCGCLLNEETGDRFRKHGLSRTELYRLWARICQRCNNKNNAQFKYYGHRGINIYKPWRHNFKKFYKYIITTIGLPKSKTIDRIDVNKGYIPGNLRWADKSVQAHNRRARGSSKYRGVFKRANGKSYQAAINYKGKHYHLGTFTNEVDAALAYNCAASKLYKKEASLNAIRLDTI